MATTRMLAQRSWRNQPATRQSVLSRASARTSSPPITPGACSAISASARGDHLLLVRAALEPRLGLQVRRDVLLRHEEEAGVGVSRLLEAARQLVQEQLDHRQEALQVRLLVDREVQGALVDPVQPGVEQV